MNNRSKFLLVALAVVGVGVFGDQGYRRFVEQPARKREREAAQIDKQIKQAEDAVFSSVRAADQLLALEQYSLPYDQELARARYRFQLPDDSRQVFERVIVVPQFAIFWSGDSPVEQIDVVALVEHVLHKTVSRPEVEHMGPIHNCEHQQQWNLVPLVFWQHRRVLKQTCFVQRPNQSLGRLGNFRVGGQQPIESPQVVGRLMPLIARILEREGKSVDTGSGGHRISFQS